MYMAWKKEEKKDLRVRQRQGEMDGSLSSPINIPCYHTLNILFRVSTKSLQLLKDLWPGFSFIFDLSTHSMPLILLLKLQEDGGHQLQGLCTCCCFYSEHLFSQICHCLTLSDAHLTPCPHFSLYPLILTFLFW